LLLRNDLDIFIVVTRGPVLPLLKIYQTTRCE